MPVGLVNSLNPDELSDLIAYIFSAGDAEHKYFNGASHKVKLDGAKALFNGKDLSGWRANLLPESFTVQDGVIKAHCKDPTQKSHLFYVGDKTEGLVRFKNFDHGWDVGGRD